MKLTAIDRRLLKPAAGITIGAVAIAVAVAIGLAFHGGSAGVFLAFSAVFFAIIVVALRNSGDYAHLFLALMWLMGFWGRYVVHQITQAPYVEAVGDFRATADSMDAVLLVCTVGGTGFLAGRLALLPFTGPLREQWRPRQPGYPAWYRAHRGLFWALALIVVFAILALNWRFGIFVRGMVTPTPLPWPLGGLFAWTTDIGLALAISVLAVWDRQCGFGVVRGFVWLCIEGAAMSFSTLSRALYIFHTLPFFVAERRGWGFSNSRRMMIGLVLIWVAVAAAVPATTTFIRLFGSDPVPTRYQEMETHSSSDQPVPRQSFDGSILQNQATTMIWLLLVERWSGLEGVMATSAHADKSFGMWRRAAFDRRSYGTVDVYTRDIAKTGFQERHARQFHYASPAGPIAFLYFSGSLWMVAAGMAIIAMLITLIELSWRWLIRDELPLAISGWYLAFIVLQLSGNLQQAITGPVMITLLFAAAWLMSAFPRSHPVNPAG